MICTNRFNLLIGHPFESSTGASARPLKITTASDVLALEKESSTKASCVGERGTGGVRRALEFHHFTRFNARSRLMFKPSAPMQP